LAGILISEIGWVEKKANSKNNRAIGDGSFLEGKGCDDFFEIFYGRDFPEITEIELRRIGGLRRWT
jgi:hypothetical protein